MEGVGGLSLLIFEAFLEKELEKVMNGKAMNWGTPREHQKLGGISTPPLTWRKAASLGENTQDKKDVARKLRMLQKRDQRYEGRSLWLHW